MNYKLIIIFIAIFITTNVKTAETFQPFLTPRWLPSEKRDNLQESTQNFIQKIQTSQLPKIAPDGNLNDFQTALKRQIKRCQKLPGNTTWRFGKKTVTRKKWCIETASAFLEMAHGSWQELWKRAKKRFLWFKSSGRASDKKVQFTGYYLPLLRAAKTADARFSYPLYLRPKDLVRLRLNGKMRWRRVDTNGQYSLYFDRYQIDYEDALSYKNLELVFVDDPIKAFFLHVQGSGKIVFPNGQGHYITYAAANGRKYVSIGKVLKNEGVDAHYYSSLQGLVQYFTERPNEIERVFPKNPSYIFFSKDTFGAKGSGGVYLTAGHSIATDNKIFPLGAITLVKSFKPIVENGVIKKWQKFTRFAINQDTGGAIRGPGRVDFFWGSGDYEELAAGGMNHQGDLYFALLP